jgi:aryl-alcohol dehydrogenase-like predicted oxidoreductase
MIALGTMTWGREADEAEARSMYALARERGVVWFDSAASYSNGEAERILGRCLRDDPKRDEVKVSTKGGYRGEDIREEIKGSLERLGVERVELYLHHHWSWHGDRFVWQDLIALRDNGLADGVGLSNCAAWQAATCCSDRFVDAIQVLYSLVKRQAEVELLPWAKFARATVFAYSPLAAGLLTGKYQRGWGDVDTRAWRLNADGRYSRRFATAQHVPRRYFDLAASLGMTPAQLAVSWVMSNATCHVVPIVGARSADQLGELLSARRLGEDEWRMVGGMFRRPPPATDRLEEADGA